MRRLSTRCMDEFINKAEKSRNTEKSNPSKKTLDFLTRFSKAYHAEGDIQQDICGMVMN